MQLYYLFLLCLVPGYVFYRFFRYGAISVFNFGLYPLVCGYFYLLIPAIIPAVSSFEETLSLSSDSFNVVDALSGWGVTALFVGYFLSDDRGIKFNVNLKLSPRTLTMASWIQLLCCSVGVIVLIMHGATLYALSGDRASSYEYYAREILDVYKLQLVFSLALVGATIVYLERKKIYVFYSLVPFVVIDALQGGRGYTFAALIVFGLNYLALNMRQFKRVVFLLALSVVFLFASAFFRRYVAVNETADPLLILFGEFFFTRLTGQFVYDNLAGHGDLLTYSLVSISKIFPQFIVLPFFDERDVVPYYTVVDEWVGAGFGLAGSIVSEAVYYGGIEFGFVSPVLISAVFFCLNRSRVIERVYGYLFFLILSSSMYLIFRTDFYSTFFSILYKFFFYFSLMILPSWKSSVFVSAPSASKAKI